MKCRLCTRNVQRLCLMWQASALSSKVSLLMIKYDLEHSGSGKGGMSVPEAIECAPCRACSSEPRSTPAEGAMCQGARGLVQS